MAENKTKKRIATKKQSIDDKILGIEPVIEKTTIVKYEDPERLYRVTNLQINNTPSTFSGLKIEAFIGCKNNEAREALINGAKEVITFDGNGKEAYKIEVIN